jgi:hypothetical protein
LQADGNRNPRFAGEVSLYYRDNGQTRYEMHQYYPQGKSGLHKTETTKYGIYDPLEMPDILQQ